MTIQLTQQTSVLFLVDPLNKENFITKGLHQSHYQINYVSDIQTHWLKVVEQCNPDLIIIFTATQNVTTLEKLSVIAKIQPKPIVVFTQQSGEKFVSDYVKAGVSAYIVGEVESKRVVSILDTAFIRFNEYQKIKAELVKTQQELTSQKMIAKAKIWLIENKQVTEKQAYQSIRKLAMDRGQKMIEVAKNILSAAH